MKPKKMDTEGNPTAFQAMAEQTDTPEGRRR